MRSTIMNFKLITVCILNVQMLDVHAFPFLSFYNRHRRLMKLRSAAILTDVPIHTCWINQKVDHFNATDSRPWKMRYFKRLDYWRQNGPIYFIIGGEETATPYYFKFGISHDLAKETNGALFMSEHRYYGKSQPVKKRNIETMKFLTTPQALADIAKLITKIKKNKKFKRSKVVVIGGSYAGNLAAWLKLVYPNLVDAAIASSAPVLAKRDFYESLEVINNIYKKYGTTDCIENIRRIFQRYDSLFQTKEGIRHLKEEENVCEEVDLTKPENKALFFAVKMESFFGISQDGNINDIKNHCYTMNETRNIIHNDTTDKEYWIPKRNCNSYDFKTAVQATSQDMTEYSWTYQTCTEYGYFFSTTSDKQPFTKNLPVEYSDKYCTDLFGASFDKRRVIDGVRKINQMFGGRSPNVTEVVFVNGELDHWSSLSVLKDISPKALAIYIPKASHCNDLYDDKTHDPQELNEARKQIKFLIKKWIGSAKKSSMKLNLTITICYEPLHNQAVKLRIRNIGVANNTFKDFFKSGI